MQKLSRWICLLWVLSFFVSSCGADSSDGKKPSSTTTTVVDEESDQASTTVWYGEYFNNAYLMEPSVLQRQDGAIAFNWGDSSPSEDIASDNFSIRWGTVAQFEEGTYRFAALADDGLRITVDFDTVLINTLDEPLVGNMIYMDMMLTEGEHHIQIDYREATGAAYLYVNWTQLSEDDGADIVQEVDGEAPSTEYITLSDWIRSDYVNLPHLQFSALQASYVPSGSEQTTTSSPSIENFSQSELQNLWQTYQDASREYELEFLGITDDDLAAPFEVEIIDTIEVSYEESGYTIEVIVWNAVPAMRILANIYHPLQPLEERLPVILSPLGCGSNVATHEEWNSVQHRAANLALRGFMVVVMGGFCDNGIIGDVPENNNSYVTYANAAGTGQQLNNLQLLIWLRMLDYLETRNDVDMSRIGVTGYSNGGGISDLLFSADRRVRVAATVATTLGKPFTTNLQNPEIFISPQYPAMQSPPHFVYNISVSSLYHPPDTDRLTQAYNNLPSELRLIAFTDLSRSNLRIIGRADLGTSIGDHNNWLALATENANLLGYDSTFELILVNGDHNYNAERRRLVTDWLVDQLQAQPVIQPPVDVYEHNTPILARSQLEPIYQGFDAFTLHDLYADSALNLIEQRRETDPFPAESILESQAILDDILLLPNRHVGENRSIQFRQSGFVLAENSIDVSRWLVSLNYDIPVYAAVTIIAPLDETVTNVNILILDTDEPLPSEEQLLAWINQGQVVTILQPPGYGTLTWSQTSRGHHAQLAPSFGYTLLGVGVNAIFRTIDLIEAQYPTTTIHLYADGVEASVIGMFGAALDTRIATAHMYNSVASFSDFMISPELPIIPPVLLISGLISTVDVSDLQAMAGERSIIIESTSDLSQFYPNW